MNNSIFINRRDVRSAACPAQRQIVGVGRNYFGEKNTRLPRLHFSRGLGELNVNHALRIQRRHFADIFYGSVLAIHCFQARQLQLPALVLNIGLNARGCKLGPEYQARTRAIAFAADAAITIAAFICKIETKARAARSFQKLRARRGSVQIIYSIVQADGPRKLRRHQFRGKRAFRRPRHVAPIVVALHVHRVHRNIARAALCIGKAETGFAHQWIQQPAPVAKYRQIAVAIVAGKIIHAVNQYVRAHPVEFGNIGAGSAELARLVQRIRHPLRLCRRMGKIIICSQQQRSVLAAQRIQRIQTHLAQSGQRAQKVQLCERGILRSSAQRAC